jgi:hypothetical protein
VLGADPLGLPSNAPTFAWIAVETTMDVKEAVRIAKEHATIVFEGEKPSIEEVWFDEATNEWCVTVGIQRSHPSDEPSPMASVLGRPRASRASIHYKTIRIDDKTKMIKSTRMHENTPISTT